MTQGGITIGSWTVCAYPQNEKNIYTTMTFINSIWLTVIIQMWYQSLKELKLKKNLNHAIQSLDYIQNDLCAKIVYICI